MSARWSVMICNPQREVECRATIGRGFSPDAAAVPMYDAMHDGEADAGSFEVLRAMQPLEHAEQLADISHVEADPVITDPEHPFAVDLSRSNLDHGLRARSGVLECI